MQTLGQFNGNVRILSIHNFLSRKFATFVGKIQLLVPPSLIFKPRTPLICTYAWCDWWCQKNSIA